VQRQVRTPGMPHNPSAVDPEMVEDSQASLSGPPCSMSAGGHTSPVADQQAGFDRNLERHLGEARV
jgi:hypothetical protein